MNNKIQVQAYSIPEFCEAHSISRAMFYLLCKGNKAPQTMRVGKRRLISAESAQRWREQMESNHVQQNKT